MQKAWLFTGGCGGGTLHLDEANAEATDRSGKNTQQDQNRNFFKHGKLESFRHHAPRDRLEGSGQIAEVRPEGPHFFNPRSHLHFCGQFTIGGIGEKIES